MKWRSTARGVVDRLSAKGRISPDQKEQVLSMFSGGRPLEAFHLIQGIMSEFGSPIGWNKVWDQSGVRGWYGPCVLQYPLRMVTSEIEHNRTLYAEICSHLLNIWQGHIQQEFKPVSTRSSEFLEGVGIFEEEDKISRAALTLLRRLNMDQRDHPFLERWRWSGGVGLAMLSDGGRFQVSVDSVWARAFELSLDRRGGINNSMVEFLSEIEPVVREVKIPDEAMEDPSTLEKVTDVFKCYGYGKRLHDTIILSDQAGDFPRMALQIWV